MIVLYTDSRNWKKIYGVFILGICNEGEFKIYNEEETDRYNKPNFGGRKLQRWTLLNNLRLLYKQTIYLCSTNINQKFLLPSYLDLNSLNNLSVC